jgi:chromosome segregation protein
VYVKRLELTNFKSFGGTTQVPIRPGFTVISGPNGSGKSNLLDAILFCLGLAGSKGMRAERLPDLVNQAQSSRGRTVEAAVTVTFDLSDEPDLWALIQTPVNPDTVAESDSAVVVGDVNRIELSEPAAEDASASPGGSPSENSNGRLPDYAAPGVVVEWSVTRKLRVTQQGTYTSNYYINGQPCTLTELHDKLNQLRIYPEGYNVVLQGDVTRIISMNSRERREIIDELAGVASFDRKINQAKEKLDAVKDREDRYHIVERELIDQRDRLSQDRIKAEKYQKLRAELQSKEQWEAVIRYNQAAQAAQNLATQILQGTTEATSLTQQLTDLDGTITTTSTELEALNVKVRALGEAEQIALQSQLATREAELRQLQRQAKDYTATGQELERGLGRSQTDITEQTAQLAQLTTTQQQVETQELQAAQQQRQAAHHALEQARQSATDSAASAEAWVQEQTQLRHEIDGILANLEPQRTAQAQLQERASQLERQVEEQTAKQQELTQQLTDRQADLTTLTEQFDAATTQVQNLAQHISGSDGEVQIQKDTQARLLNEQREKQRQLDRLEAQTQATQEAQGTHATQVILKNGLAGVHGLVAQLGQVQPRFQLALETAAGGRLGQLVVDNDSIAAAAIEILKQQRAGRATFLPLNKIRAPQIPDRGRLRNLAGSIDFAINLIDCDDRYWDVFAYVFGSTVVFERLDQARRHMGEFRIVTLEGELLESSGAMTGGSAGRSALHFGKTTAGESAEITALRERLAQIETVLSRCQTALVQAELNQQGQGKGLIEARQAHRELQLKKEQATKEINQITPQLATLTRQLDQNTTELAEAQKRLTDLAQALPQQEAQLAAHRQTLSELEESQTHSEWQRIQAHLRQLETALDEREKALRAIEQRVLDLTNQRQRLEEKITEGHQRLSDQRVQQTSLLQQQSTIATQQAEIQTTLTELQAAMVELEKVLGTERQNRDALDRRLRDQQTQRQQLDWQRQKLEETQVTRRTEQLALQETLVQQRAELPEVLPEIPDNITQDIGQLQHELRSLQRRLQAMEPVNMMALEEYDKVQERLVELTEKLTTLQEERTELLLRIENFTTLRVRAFREAYDAVDVNFQQIFATLSDGDGRLQLEDQQDPFNGGLTLIAHPKGKQVQRLASMSGGEKSLTALSFIFALQRYRPSPFYAFDEVDMFLDGANVERLSRMIKHQAQQAQFIVVSLRRPMIESAQRTIGVTQARGAYTQVIGIQLEGQKASPTAPAVKLG